MTMEALSAYNHYGFPARVSFSSLPPPAAVNTARKWILLETKRSFALKRSYFCYVATELNEDFV